MAVVGGCCEQGAELTLKDSSIERSRRMGVSALGSGTRALLQDNVISDNGEHGIAQGTVRRGRN